MTEVTATGVQVPATSSNLFTAGAELAEILAILQYLADEFASLKAQLLCQRCSTPAPPPPRYPHDPWSRDERPAHSCGKNTAGMR
jgi:hypothetical protein